MNTDETLYRSVGGRLIAMGAGEPIWDFGWTPPQFRSPEQHEAHEAAERSMPTAWVFGRDNEDADFADLTRTWKHPRVVEALGFPYTGTHQLTGSCFPAGTPVRMADGSEKAIEAIQVGESVITHEGRARRVTETMTRLYDGDVVTLHVAGFAFPLEMTADHQVAILPSRSEARWRPADEIEWKRADEVVEGDRVLIGYNRERTAPATIDLAKLLGERALILDDLMEGRETPVSNVGMAQWIVRRSGIDWRGKVKLVRSRSEKALNRHVPVCPSLGRFIGLYLAEGGCETEKESGKVVFTFSADEEALCGEVLALACGLFGAEGETFISNERGTSRKVVFNNSTLAAALKALVPGNVYSKRVPGVFFGADPETKAALILGWLHGDGYVALPTEARDGRIQGVTASPGLARDVTTLALSCGMRASVSRRKARGASRAAFDVYLTGPRAVALFPLLVAACRKLGVLERGTDVAATPFGYARVVKRSERRAVERLRVFDFEVEEDHSFIAGGLVVHNCVGAGMGNATASLNFFEVLVLGDAEKLFLPFYPYAYGRGRYHCGMRGRGEGSQGSCQAQAVKEDGVLDNALEGLPKPTSTSDGIVWGSKVEMEWSAGDREPCTKWLQEGKKHVITGVAKLRNHDEVRLSIVNGKPVTVASMYAFRASVVGEGKEACLLARKQGSWAHQMSIHAYWKHPKHGPIFWLMNQWGLRAHGTCPTGLPEGGAWITAADVDWICRDEAYSFSGHSGWAAKEIDWSMI